MATDYRAQYLPIVKREAARAGVPWQMLDAAIMQESRYNPNAENTGAVGLGQLRRAAAQDVGLTPEQRWDPELNIRGAADYLAIASRGVPAGDWDTPIWRYHDGGYQPISRRPAQHFHVDAVRARARELGHAWGGGPMGGGSSVASATPAPR